MSEEIPATVPSVQSSKKPSVDEEGLTTGIGLVEVLEHTDSSDSQFPTIAPNQTQPLNLQRGPRGSDASSNNDWGGEPTALSILASEDHPLSRRNRDQEEGNCSPPFLDYSPGGGKKSSRRSVRSGRHDSPLGSIEPSSTVVVPGRRNSAVQRVRPNYFQLKHKRRDSRLRQNAGAVALLMQQNLEPFEAGARGDSRKASLTSGEVDKGEGKIVDSVGLLAGLSRSSRRSHQGIDAMLRGSFTGRQTEEEQLGCRVPPADQLDGTPLDANEEPAKSYRVPQWSERLPFPSIMDLSLCDLHELQNSFIHHTSIFNNQEMLDRFKRLVIRVIKEEQEALLEVIPPPAEPGQGEEEESEEGAEGKAEASKDPPTMAFRDRVSFAERDTIYEAALSTGFLNGLDTVPVGVPARFLQKARALLMWEYERRVAYRMENVQKEKFQIWRYNAEMQLYTSQLKKRRRVQSNDSGRGASQPWSPMNAAVNLTGSSFDHGISILLQHGKQGVPRGADGLPMPDYLTRSSIVNHSTYLSEMGGTITAPPSYTYPWNVDPYDTLSLTLAAERRMKETVEEAPPSPDKRGSRVLGSANGALDEPIGVQSNNDASTDVKSELPGSEWKGEIPLATFVYVVSRALFRLHYAQVFPTGLFNRELIDPYYFPEPEELDPAYFFRCFPHLRQKAEAAYRLHLECASVQAATSSASPIEPEDFITVHRLLCPPKKMSSILQDTPLPWLHLTAEEEDALLPPDFTIAMCQDRRIYRQYLQSVAAMSGVRQEINQMMTICRLVAFEFFEGVDSTQRGVISWAEFTDALIEYAEVAHHRQRADESVKVMRTCASVFDHYRVDAFPAALHHLGYTKSVVEVRSSRSMVILKGPYDYAVCDGASGMSVMYKFLMRKTVMIMEETSKAKIIQERLAAKGAVEGINFTDAEAAQRPWRANAKVPGVFIRYLDGKRLDEAAAVSVAKELKKNEDGDSLPGTPSTKPTTGEEGSDEANQKNSKTGQKEEPKKEKTKTLSNVSIASKDDVVILSSFFLENLLLGFPPFLLLLCSDLMLRVYVMVPMQAALPETAVLRTYETVTCMDWCGIASNIHEVFKGLMVCGTRSGSLLVMDIRTAMSRVPRLHEARHGMIGSAFSSNSSYAERASITFQDDIYKYILFDKKIHNSIICSVNLSDSGTLVSSGLDGEVFMGRLQYAVSTTEIIPIRKFNVGDSGVRSALVADLAQVIVVQTVANKINVYGIANQKVHVELYDPQAPHFFPIISMLVVDELDQLITADTSGFVKVWSLSQCTAMSSFYALSEKIGHASQSNGGGHLYEVNRQREQAVTGEGKIGILQKNQQTIEKALHTDLALAPLRNIAYDHISHRLLATGLNNAVTCRFVFGQGGVRAHMERISFVGLSFRHQWVVTMSCSDCRLWNLHSGAMVLGLRANNAEYNLLAAERMNHTQRGNGDSSAGLMSNLNELFEDHHQGLEKIKMMPRRAADVIRSVAASKALVTSYKRVPLHIPKNQIARVRREMQLLRFAENPMAIIHKRHGTISSGPHRASDMTEESSGSGANLLEDVSNQSDNTRDTNVKQSDILCAVMGQHDRLLIYALSTGDIRVHRSDSGRLVKTYVTQSPSTEEVLAAALFYRHIYTSNQRAKGDDSFDNFSSVSAPADGSGVGGGAGGGLSSSVMAPYSILRSLTNQQRVETVTALLQRMVTDTKDVVSHRSKLSFHTEPVHLMCIGSTQELVVTYADGVIRYFPLIGTSLIANKVVLPEYLVLKAVQFFNVTPASRNIKAARVAGGESSTNHNSASTSAGSPKLLRSSIDGSVLHGSRFSTSNMEAAAPPPTEVFSSLLESTTAPAITRVQHSGFREEPLKSLLPRNLRKNQKEARESLEVLNQGIFEADAVSLVAVSTHLQVIAIIQVTGVVSVIDVSSGTTGAETMTPSGNSSTPMGATVIHTFTTKEEATAVSFMGAYPCLMIADRCSELHFFLVKGSSGLALVEDFFKSVHMGRYLRQLKGVPESASNLRSGSVQGKTTRRPTELSQSDKVEGFPPHVWSVRMPYDVGTPISIHFDHRYSTVYVGTREGFISSFGVQKFILATDLSPLCISTAEVSLDTYYLALKQQQESNQSVILNFLLILFGLTQQDILLYLKNKEENAMEVAGSIRGMTSKASLQTSMTNTLGSDPSVCSRSKRRPSTAVKWKNSLVWVLENCEPLLRGGLVDEVKLPDRLDPIIDLEEVTLSDLLLAVTILQDATHLISLRPAVTKKLNTLTGPKPSPSAPSGGTTSFAVPLKGTITNPDHPAWSFLHLREHLSPEDELLRVTDDVEEAFSHPVLLTHSEILQIRRWVEQAISHTAFTPTVDATRPWECGWRRQMKPFPPPSDQRFSFSELHTHPGRWGRGGLRRQGSEGAFNETGGERRLSDATTCTSISAVQDSDGESEGDSEGGRSVLHLLAARWVESLFQRHGMFMTDNCPLALLSPAGLLERARREKIEREKDILRRLPLSGNEDFAWAPRMSMASQRGSSEARGKGNWDEFVEGVIPRVPSGQSSNGGVLKEMAALLSSDMGVSRIVSRRNGYLYVGLDDGSVSLWTPYAAARVAQICPSTSLQVSIYRLREAIKIQFKQLHEFTELQRQREVFEADTSLGRNASEGESKIKAKIKNMLVNHQLERMKKQGELLDEMQTDVSEAENGSTANSPRSGISGTLTVVKKTVVSASEAQMSDIRQRMLFCCGFESMAELLEKYLYVEDLFYLPMRMVELCDVDHLEPSWYHSAVDVSADRLLFDICGDDGSEQPTAVKGGPTSAQYTSSSMVYNGVRLLSTPDLLAKKDLRLVMAVLNHALETPTTHEVDFINFAHDWLLSNTSREEVNELARLKLINQKMVTTHAKEQRGGTPSWMRRLRGASPAERIPLPYQSTKAGGLELDGTNSLLVRTTQTSSVFGEDEGLGIDELAGMRALRFRVGAALELEEGALDVEPVASHSASSTRSRFSSHEVSTLTAEVGSYHSIRKRSQMRCDLNAGLEQSFTLPTEAVVPEGNSPSSTTRRKSVAAVTASREGVLHRMAVDRLTENCPGNDFASKMALERRVAALGPGVARTAEPYEKAVLRDLDLGGPGPAVASMQSPKKAMSPSSGEDEDDGTIMTPHRAEAWLFTSTFSHQQPLLVLSEEPLTPRSRPGDESEREKRRSLQHSLDQLISPMGFQSTHAGSHASEELPTPRTVRLRHQRNSSISNSFSLQISTPSPPIPSGAAVSPEAEVLHLFQSFQQRTESPRKLPETLSRSPSFSVPSQAAPVTADSAPLKEEESGVSLNESVEEEAACIPKPVAADAGPQECHGDVFFTEAFANPSPPTSPLRSRSGPSPSPQIPAPPRAAPDPPPSDPVTSASTTTTSSGVLQLPHNVLAASLRQTLTSSSRIMPGVSENLSRKTSPSLALTSSNGPTKVSLLASSMGGGFQWNNLAEMVNLNGGGVSSAPKVNVLPWDLQQKPERCRAQLRRTGAVRPSSGAGASQPSTPALPVFNAFMPARITRALVPRSPSVSMCKGQPKRPHTTAHDGTTSRGSPLRLGSRSATGGSGRHRREELVSINAAAPLGERASRGGTAMRPSMPIAGTTLPHVTISVSSDNPEWKKKEERRTSPDLLVLSSELQEVDSMSPPGSPDPEEEGFSDARALMSRGQGASGALSSDRVGGEANRPAAGTALHASLANQQPLARRKHLMEILPGPQHPS